LKLVECVPNFSEGRRREVIDAIVAEARTRNVKVLDIESDADHNRSVLTFVGSPKAVKEAMIAVSAKAIELIDLNYHQGQHPRMGAVDVIPFIPISDVTMEECIKIAKEFGAEYATRFGVPVYLYEEAATRPDRRNLSDIRKGEFEGLREEIERNPDRAPDFGPNHVHPTAGATAVGARKILIAYNINLGTTDISVAKQIAKQIRGKDGGFSAVKALGFELKDRGMVQVSINMVDYKASQLFKVFELVQSLATGFGVPVIASEVVGLIPLDALTETAEFYLRLHGFDGHQILERRLMEKDKLVGLDLMSFADEVRSDRAVPGGGSVSAYSASLAAGLVSMVAQLTLAKEQVEIHPIVEEIQNKSEAHQLTLLSLVDEDARSFTSLIEAYKMPRIREDEKRKRTGEIQRRLKGAADVPLKTAEITSAVIELAADLSKIANMNAISDLQTAIYVGHASAQGALANVHINLTQIIDEEYCAEMRSKISKIQVDLDQYKSKALDTINARMSTSKLASR
jgi:glutamate formiminotransferase/formiminotetrahydrofolate cyclodeaminase